MHYVNAKGTFDDGSSGTSGEGNFVAWMCCLYSMLTGCVFFHPRHEMSQSMHLCTMKPLKRKAQQVVG